METMNVNRFLLDGRTYHMEDAEARRMALESSEGIVTLTKESTDNVALMKMLAERRNILHNWDFRNPVNQRGQDEYAVSSSTYHLDRWLGNLQVNIKNGFITLTRTTGTNPSFAQRIEFPSRYSGMMVTMSIKYRTTAPSFGFHVYGRGEGPNEIYLRKYFPPSGEWAIFSSQFTMLSADTHFPQFSISSFVNRGAELGDYIDIQAVKLELGTVSTLANDPPMDFGRELAVCQRYQLASWHSHLNPVISTFSSRLLNITSNQLMFVVPVPVTMRIHPSIPVAPLVRRLHDNAIVTGFTFTCEAWSNANRVIAYKASHNMTEAWLHFHTDNPIVFDANL